MNPRAKKKARAMSHGIGSPKAEKAAEKVRVLVRTEAPRPMSATAPSGSGWVMIPTIVARKMASSCHALRETPLGTGTNQRITPVAMEARSGLIAAPCHGAGAGTAGDGEAAEAEEETLTKADLWERERGTWDFTKDLRVIGLGNFESRDLRGFDRLREADLFNDGRVRDRDLAGNAREQDPERARDAIVAASAREVEEESEEEEEREKGGV